MREIDNANINDIEEISELPYENFKNLNRVCVIVRDFPFKYQTSEATYLNAEMEFATIKYADGSEYKGDVVNENQK